MSPTPKSRMTETCAGCSVRVERRNAGLNHFNRWLCLPCVALAQEAMARIAAWEDEEADGDWDDD